MNIPRILSSFLPRKTGLTAVLGLSVLVTSITHADDLQNREDVQQFFAEMQKKHGFEAEQLGTWFEAVEINEGIIESISKPAERTLEWRDYRKIFIKPERIEAGQVFVKEHAEVLAKAEKEFGVPPQMVAAIIGVETFYGRWKGKYSVLEALSTLAFGYPKRSKFFRSELEQYLLLAREQNFDPRELMGSYAGAMGYGQFIPSSYRHYAIDFDGNGQADLLGSKADAIGSVANYLARHGWERGAQVAWQVSPAKTPSADVLPKRQKPVHTLADYSGLDINTQGLPSETAARLMAMEGDQGREYWLGLKNFYVITRYNHSDLYALAVYQLSEAIKEL